MYSSFADVPKPHKPGMGYRVFVDIKASEESDNLLLRKFKSGSRNDVTESVIGHSAFSLYALRYADNRESDLSLIIIVLWRYCRNRTSFSLTAWTNCSRWAWVASLFMINA